MTETEPWGYAFGCPEVDRDMTPKLPSIEATFEAQRLLWNALVEIEADNRRRYRGIVENGTEEAAAAQAAVARLQDRIAAAVARLRDRIAAAMALPAKQRGRKQIAAWRAELKTAKLAARTARKISAGLQKPALAAIEQERREAVKAAVRAAGLWWCHSECIVERYEVARGRAMRTNAELRPAREPAFGMLRVRWQNGIPLHVLTNGGDTLARLALDDRPRPRGLLTLCIESDGREKDYVMLPVCFRRPLPAGSVVRNISLFRRRTADRLRWHGAVCVVQPAMEAPAPHTDAWLTLRQDWLTDDGSFRRRMEHVRWLQHVLDSKAAAFASTTTDLPLCQRIEAAIEDRKGKGIVYGDIRRLAADSEQAGAFLVSTWHLWSEMHHLRARCIRYRDDRYGRLAADLTRSHARLEVEKPFMVFTAKTVDRPAWGRFCEILTKSGKRHGCEVVFTVPERQKDDTVQTDAQ